jgi:hypothetical protein
MRQLGIPKLAVIGPGSVISGRQTTAKAFTKDVFINQEQKLGDQR